MYWKHRFLKVYILQDIEESVETPCRPFPPVTITTILLTSVLFLLVVYFVTMIITRQYYIFLEHGCATYKVGINIDLSLI